MNNLFIANALSYQYSGHDQDDPGNGGIMYFFTQDEMDKNER